MDILVNVLLDFRNTDLLVGECPCVAFNRRIAILQRINSCDRLLYYFVRYATELRLCGKCHSAGLIKRLGLDFFFTLHECEGNLGAFRPFCHVRSICVLPCLRGLQLFCLRLYSNSVGLVFILPFIVKPSAGLLIDGVGSLVDDTLMAFRLCAAEFSGAVRIFHRIIYRDGIPDIDTLILQCFDRTILVLNLRIEGNLEPLTCKAKNLRILFAAKGKHQLIGCACAQIHSALIFYINRTCC